MSKIYLLFQICGISIFMGIFILKEKVWNGEEIMELFERFQPQETKRTEGMELQGKYRLIKKMEELVEWHTKEVCDRTKAS